MAVSKPIAWRLSGQAPWRAWCAGSKPLYCAAILSSMKSRPPTSQEIDALLAFLPLFSADGFEPVARWAGGETSGGAMPWPQYNPAVEAFMRAAGQETWRDEGYDPQKAARMLQDADLVGRASLAEIRTMLTYCVRGERFSDGHWAAMIEQGYLQRLLERLRQLRQETP